MQAVVFEQVGKVAVKDVPEPTLDVDEVLVKVAACGICGTDLHILNGEYPATFPLVPGHEFAGTVVRVGSAVTAAAVGDRVCVDPNIFCSRCWFCRSGKVHFCQNLDAVGVRRPGGFAQCCAVPQRQVYPLPDHVGFSEGAMAEPLSCTLRGIEQANVVPGQTVLILGGGAIGGLLAQLARLAGAATVIVSEPIEARRKLVSQLAADAVIDPTNEALAAAVKKTDPLGADVVFEAAGRADTAKETFSAAKRGATIVYFGVVPPDQTIQISPYEIYANEWKVVGSFINPHTFQRAVHLLACGRVKVKPFITHQFPMAQFRQALETFGRPDSYKVQIVPG